MKTKLISALMLAFCISVGAYAQDSTAMSKKEMRKQERAERKARVKESLNSAGEDIGDAATEMKRGAKRKAKVAGEAVDSAATKTGRAVNKGLDKTENAIITESDKLKAKRDSSRAAKAERDTL